VCKIISGLYIQFKANLGKDLSISGLEYQWQSQYNEILLVVILKEKYNSKVIILTV
jgi:hypothetical protein